MDAQIHSTTLGECYKVVINSADGTGTNIKSLTYTVPWETILPNEVRRYRLKASSVFYDTSITGIKDTVFHTSINFNSIQNSWTSSGSVDPQYIVCSTILDGEDYASRFFTPPIDTTLYYPSRQISITLLDKSMSTAFDTLPDVSNLSYTLFLIFYALE